jgi:hypothetical protein
MIREFLLSDIQLSPLLLHVLLLVISSIKAITLKLCSRVNESQGWDSAVMVLLFCNPLLAFFADSFWNIWLQSFLLGLPLYFAAFYFRSDLFGYAEYSDPAAAHMLCLFMFLIGHLLSIGFLLIRYIWQSL